MVSGPFDFLLEPESRDRRTQTHHLVFVKEHNMPRRWDSRKFTWHLPTSETEYTFEEILNRTRRVGIRGRIINVVEALRISGSDEDKKRFVDEAIATAGQLMQFFPRRPHQSTAGHEAEMKDYIGTILIEAVREDSDVSGLIRRLQRDEIIQGVRAEVEGAAGLE